MFNVSLWSSSKKLTVAKAFLFQYKKNVLIHSKIKKGTNIDIHLENISQFPDEEEVLFLPYCTFGIKSFKKIKENQHEYYALELLYSDKDNMHNYIEKVKYNEFII